MNAIVLGIIIILLLVVVALLVPRLRRSKELHQRFGPEYERTLASTKDRSRAEAELERRVERVEALKIRPLSPPDRSRFAEAWRTDQARFVDDPRGAVKEADRLVADLMQVRGYPLADFEQRAADISVDHPRLVQEYRAAHDIAQRDANGAVTTEDLRAAMVHYRALFEDLLETTDARGNGSAPETFAEHRP